MKNKKTDPASYPASSREQVAGSVPEPPFEEVWERIREAVGVRNQSQLADILEIKTPSITGAKRRGIFPLAWAYKLAWQYSVSLDFLLFGPGQGREMARDSATAGYVDPGARLVEEALTAAGVTIRAKQKAAILEIVNEELKTTTVQMLRALKRGSFGGKDV